ncbi:MAG: DUF721 domain-containing protein [Elusimicrobia bacterium]|nr:DUF721 domain-containing protein [Elusimicrobiota bacterium]
MFIPASDIVKELLKKYKLSTDDYAVFDIWEKELGPLAGKVKMVGKKGKKILIKVNNPVYRQEISMRKKELIKKINGHFDREVVNSIEFA